MASPQASLPLTPWQRLLLKEVPLQDLYLLLQALQEAKTQLMQGCYAMTMPSGYC